jgi:general secretion pathway protein G
MTENPETNEIETQPVQVEAGPPSGGVKALGAFALALIFAVLVSITVHAVVFIRAAGAYNDFLCAPPAQHADLKSTVNTYERFCSMGGTVKDRFKHLVTDAQEVCKIDKPIPVIVPTGIKDKIKRAAGAVSRYFPIAFFKSLLDYINFKSKRDALIVGAIVLVVLFLLFMTTKIWSFLFTRLLKLLLIVTLAAWLIVLGLYLMPKKEEIKETHQVSLARLEVTMLDVALREYKIDTGRYPPAGNKNLVESLSGRYSPARNRSYFDFTVATVRNGYVLDPWGTPYFYKPPANASDADCLLYSSGPNRNDENGNGDDITCPETKTATLTSDGRLRRS